MTEEGSKATQVTDKNEEQHLATTGENSSNKGDIKANFTKS